ncbi:hypothetical protein [Reticulibacter mediterranei]|uniref:hypothetical protein n=1 Tax=Reticulibacter mediterranei TaxID=2778369 RepID=UPI001F1C1019|nr:hypothetical protein [Reticulibacter mediterranei]
MMRSGTATLLDRCWQLVLDCLDTEQAPFSKGTFVAFRKRLIDAQMDRRLIERTIELASHTQDFGSRAFRITFPGLLTHGLPPLGSVDAAPTLHQRIRAQRASSSCRFLPATPPVSFPLLLACVWSTILG